MYLHLEGERYNGNGKKSLMIVSATLRRTELVTRFFFFSFMTLVIYDYLWSK